MASSSCGRLWRRRVPTLDRQSCSAEQVPCQHQAPSRKRGREASQLRRSCRRSSTAAHANVYLQQRRQARGFGARAPWPHLQACKQRLLLANMPGRPWAPKSFRCPAQPASQAQTDDLADDSADESLSQQRNTVRMRQLPGGRILNGRPGAGFVTLRSGKRISCPRCEGSGWVGTGAVSSQNVTCCQQLSVALASAACLHSLHQPDTCIRPVVEAMPTLSHGLLCCIHAGPPCSILACPQESSQCSMVAPFALS